MGCFQCSSCTYAGNESECPLCGRPCMFDENPIMDDEDEDELEIDPDDIEDAIEEGED